MVFAVELGLWIFTFVYFERRLLMLWIFFIFRLPLAFIMFRFIRVLIMLFWVILTLPIWLLIWFLDWMCHRSNDTGNEADGIDEFDEEEEQDKE